jgi:purine-binding chemotaxis protein CheW
VAGEAGEGLALVFRVQGRLGALPLAQVIETMRPLPIEPLAGAVAFVRGLSVIRGVPVPVVDGACLLGGAAAGAGSDLTGSRFVTLRAGSRVVALVVDALLGVRALPGGSLRELPPLLREAGAGAVSALGSLDAELLLVLGSARLVPPAVWSEIDRGLPS